MANLHDYGIRLIDHGAWSDPEIEWRKSDYQTLLFNYWDVLECTDYDSLCESTEDSDLQELVSQLWGLIPSGYARPKIDYEWEVPDVGWPSSYDDSDYFREYKLSDKEDFVLHNTSQALRQALHFLDDDGIKSAEIRIFRRERDKRTLVANYLLQGSTLKDIYY